MTIQSITRKRTMLVSIVTMLILISLLLSGCPGETPSPTAPTAQDTPSAPAVSSPVTTGPAQSSPVATGSATGSASSGPAERMTLDPSKEPYKVGALFSVSGFNSPLGTPERDTAKLLEEQINARGGINGHRLEVIAYDTESEETKAVTLAKKLIEQDNVLAIIGPSATGESLAVAETTAKAGVPLVSCAASVKIVQPVNQWVFKTAETDSLAVAAIYDYLKTRNISKIAILTASGGYGTLGKEALEVAAPAAGLQIVAAETFGDKDMDMTGQLTRIKGTDAEAVICWGTNPGPAIIAKNMRQLNMDIPLLQSHGVANAKFLELAGEAANGVVLPAGKLLVHQTLPNSDPQKQLLTDYAQSFQAKYGRPADTFGGYAYDSLMLVAQALQKSGPDRAALRDEIEKTTGYIGITGAFNMSPTEHNGLGKDTFVMIKVVDGKWTLEK